MGSVFDYLPMREAKNLDTAVVPHEVSNYTFFNSCIGTSYITNRLNKKVFSCYN